MADATDLARWLAAPNVRAFLRVIRAGETSQDDNAYRMMFGGELLESFADHPRRAITRKLGTQLLTSTAAGAYQFLSRTWDGLVKQWGFADFEPKTQDLGCVALIVGRKAIDDVLAGRFEAAVAKCAREWASLPGSPYGQPVKTMAQARAVYEQWGGQYAEQASAPQPITDPQPKETDTMPLPLFASLALPMIVEAIPKLGKLFGSGSEVAERNIKAAETVIGIVQDAVGAKNAQEAAEILKSDPQAVQAASQAIEAAWYELSEAGGGGIDGARKNNAAMVQSGQPLHHNPAIWISALLMVFPLMLITDVLFVHPDNYTGELRVQIVTAVLAVIAMVGGYWLGTSFSSAKKDERQAGGASR